MPRKSRKTVGVIGLGIIGERAAAGLRAAGFHVSVWNRTPRAVPNFLASPAEVADAAEVIQLFVADGRAAREVLEAMRERLTPEHVIACSATIGVEATHSIAKFVQEECGAGFLDAPFTGSKIAAERRQLVYYVGGDEATFLRARPMLEATSKAIVRIGEIGDAAVVKVATNMIAAVSVQALAEALVLVRRMGLAPEALAAALEHNACRSGTIDLKLPKMLSDDYEPHFSLKHMFKDVQLGVQMANEHGVDVSTAAVTAGLMYGGIKRGWGDLDFAALYKLHADGDEASAPALEPASAGATSVQQETNALQDAQGAHVNASNSDNEGGRDANELGGAAPAAGAKESLGGHTSNTTHP